ncbi:MAG: hypothetical protein U0821_12380 [Chloroflexota bacterium]
MAQAAESYAPVRMSTPQSRLIAGAIAGIVGGTAFGAIMGMMGMLPMVGSLIGSQSAGSGLMVHLVISAIIGAGFGLLLGDRSTTLGTGALWGTSYGIVWWILGPLLIMPLMMGMGPQFGMAFSPPMLMSLLGHIVYGALLGVAHPSIARRLA